MIDFIEKVAERTGLPVGIKSAIGKRYFWEELALRMKEIRGQTLFRLMVEKGEQVRPPYIFRPCFFAL